MKGLYCRTGGSDSELKFIIQEMVSWFLALCLYNPGFETFRHE